MIIRIIYPSGARLELDIRPMSGTTQEATPRRHPLSKLHNQEVKILRVTLNGDSAPRQNMHSHSRHDMSFISTVRCKPALPITPRATECASAPNRQHKITRMSLDRLTIASRQRQPRVPTTATSLSSIRIRSLLSFDQISTNQAYSRQGQVPLHRQHQ